jgi:hypothetical protein
MKIFGWYIPNPTDIYINKNLIESNINVKKYESYSLDPLCFFLPPSCFQFCPWKKIGFFISRKTNFGF